MTGFANLQSSNELWERSYLAYPILHPFEVSLLMRTIFDRFMGSVCMQGIVCNRQQDMSGTSARDPVRWPRVAFCGRSE